MEVSTQFLEQENSRTLQRPSLVFLLQLQWRELEYISTYPVHQGQAASWLWRGGGGWRKGYFLPPTFVSKDLVSKGLVLPKWSYLSLWMGCGHYVWLIFIFGNGDIWLFFGSIFTCVYVYALFLYVWGHICVYVCISLWTSTWRPGVDAGNHTQLLFHIIHQGSISQSDPGLTSIATVPSHLALGIP